MEFREARLDEVATIVNMLAADSLGQSREMFSNPLPQEYVSAFEEISNDPNQELIVAIDDEGKVAGVFQLTYIRYLTYKGGMRAMIEGVRVREDLRGQGVGHTMFEWAIARSKERGAHLLQLTTDKRRPEALKFYEKLGFKASHEGMKLHFT